jgi:hypothetical protein
MMGNRPERDDTAPRLFAELKLQALNFALKLREAARDRNLVAEKNSPDNHPGDEQTLKVLH